jgi:hypothetical protein
MKYFILVVLFGCFFFSCTDTNPELLIGKWQSLNDRNLLVEYTDDKEYILIRLKQSVVPFQKGDTVFNMSSSYKITSNKGNYLRIINPPGYGDDGSLKSEVEFINNDRIIIYNYKHHGILDLADEFARTSGTYKFDSIMASIMKTPEDFWE